MMSVVYIKEECIDEVVVFFFFNDTATTEIYTLSLHDALPIFAGSAAGGALGSVGASDPYVHRSVEEAQPMHADVRVDRKSTRLNSSHANISYAVFCLKKKRKNLQCFTSPSEN